MIIIVINSCIYISNELVLIVLSLPFFLFLLSIHTQNWMTQSGFAYTQDSNLDLSEYEETIDELRAKSAYWASLPTTQGATTSISSQAFNIECSDDDVDVVQVFNVDASSLEGQGYSSYVFNEHCSDKTILLNVQGGGSVTFTTKHIKWTKDGQVQVGGWANFPSCMNSAILWNFPNAIDVHINGSDEVQGSLLVTGNLDFQTSGQSGRTMVLGDLTQNAWGSEFHSFDFNPPTPLPDRHCEPPEILPEFPEEPPPEAATESPQHTCEEWTTELIALNTGSQQDEGVTMQRAATTYANDCSRWEISYGNTRFYSVQDTPLGAGCGNMPYADDEGWTVGAPNYSSVDKKHFPTPKITAGPCGENPPLACAPLTIVPNLPSDRPQNTCPRVYCVDDADPRGMLLLLIYMYMYMYMYMYYIIIMCI